jgi:NADPH:quinone reductase-like Zn-dependent oxidoreductase
MEDAKALGIVPVVDFDFDPTTLKRRFDIVFDTAGTLPVKAARTLLKPGGRILDINVSPASMATKIRQARDRHAIAICVSPRG